LIVDVLGEDILVERIAGGAMHEQEARLAHLPWALGQELPAPLLLLVVAVDKFELLPRPEDGTFSGRVEALGVEHRALVMVAEQPRLAIHHEIYTLARVGPITHDITQAIYLLDALRLDVGKDCLECFEVAVNITDYRLHD